ncbi:helix-turn-helix domain-containing protein [Thermococcus argininiproducens]|uniref:Helix-turn-helix domain-containing protein n=1 Tax=Thermococcus argininiproducens TaxID=2866384 RepID=A0A9E7SDC7_9EURY|nr:helix-turn-helix domain-containing protein [Thermococcus argininiproducens]USH00447.1 helix-turn-helix domain-containing protein [Thermococcus argininiproducens]
MRVHKEKYKKAVKMLEEGKSYREISKELGLSFSQIRDISRNMGIYVDLEERKRELRRLKREIKKLERYKAQLEKEIEKKRSIIEGLEEAVEELNSIDKLVEDILHKFYMGGRLYIPKEFRDLEEKMKKFHGSVVRLNASVYVEKAIKVLEKVSH